MTSLKSYSYWWEAAPPEDVGTHVQRPAKADVVVVGAG